MLFRRIGMTSKTKRITLSVIALALALLISFLQDDKAPAPQTDARAGATNTQTAEPSQGREAAVAQAIQWLEDQEGGAHRGHAIARHVGKSDAALRRRLDNSDISAASSFYDLETAAVHIVRTIRHQPNDARVRSWLSDNDTRRLALRRTFEKPIGRIVRRNGDTGDGKSAVAVLVKHRDGDRQSYRLLTAYVER